MKFQESKYKLPRRPCPKKMVEKHSFRGKKLFVVKFDQKIQCSLYYRHSRTQTLLNSGTVFLQSKIDSLQGKIKDSG